LPYTFAAQGGAAGCRKGRKGLGVVDEFQPAVPSLLADAADGVQVFELALGETDGRAVPIGAE
jgi:hypothetical protein